MTDENTEKDTRRTRNLLQRVFYFYYDGFRRMTIGRTLWMVILVKLTIMFLVLKLFFFPDFLEENATDGDKAGYVVEQMSGRSSGQP